MVTPQSRIPPKLKSSRALSLLNDLVTNVTAAYTGQFDPATGGNTNGVVWIENELQEMVVIPITTSSLQDR